MLLPITKHDEKKASEFDFSYPHRVLLRLKPLIDTLPSSRAPHIAPAESTLICMHSSGTYAPKTSQPAGAVEVSPDVLPPPSDIHRTLDPESPPIHGNYCATIAPSCTHHSLTGRSYNICSSPDARLRQRFSELPGSALRRASRILSQRMTTFVSLIGHKSAEAPGHPCYAI